MSDITNDLNLETYQSLLKCDEWYAVFKEQYVVFVDGIHVDFDSNRESLLERVRDKYKDQPVFLFEVDRNPESIDIPTLLEVCKK